MLNQTLPKKNQETNQNNKITPLFPEAIPKIKEVNDNYYPKDLFPNDISKEKLEGILTTSIEFIFVYDVKPFHEVHPHLLQGCIVKDIYHNDPDNYKFILFNQAYFFDNVYKKIDARYKETSIHVIHKDHASMNPTNINYNPNLIIHEDDIENGVDEVEENDKTEINQSNVELLTSPEELIKIINIVSELYIIDPYMFKNQLRQLNQKIKLHNDIKNISIDKKNIKNLYSCISLFDKCCKNKSYNDAYKHSCKYYNVEEKMLRSIISKRNNYLRNRV